MMNFGFPAIFDAFRFLLFNGIKDNTTGIHCPIKRFLFNFFSSDF